MMVPGQSIKVVTRAWKNTMMDESATEITLMPDTVGIRHVPGLSIPRPEEISVAILVFYLADKLTH